MPEVSIEIGGRNFDVACQDGEEHFLQSAAKVLNEEAKVLAAQVGRVPEARMLLMAGLMLADKAGGLKDKLEQAEQALAERDAELATLRNAPSPEPVRVEVPVVPEGVEEMLTRLAERSEALAAKVTTLASDNTPES